jgi:hypothetical protein
VVQISEFPDSVEPTKSYIAGLNAFNMSLIYYKDATKNTYDDREYDSRPEAPTSAVRQSPRNKNRIDNFSLRIPRLSAYIRHTVAEALNQGGRTFSWPITLYRIRKGVV